MQEIYEFIKNNRKLPKNILGIEFQPEPDSLNTINVDQINIIHQLADMFEYDARNRGGYNNSIKPNQYDLLDEKVVYLLFGEESTRTRGSFTIAAESLGAKVRPINLKESAMGKGESLDDMFSLLETNYGADLIVYRGDEDLRTFDLSNIHIPIINAGDPNQHPSQAILDTYVMKKEAGVDDIRALNFNVMFAAHTRDYRAAQSLALLLNYTDCNIINVFPADGHPIENKWMYAVNSQPFLHFIKGRDYSCFGEYPYPWKEDIDHVEYFHDKYNNEVVDGEKLRQARQDRKEYMYQFGEAIKDVDILYLCRPTIEGEQAIVHGLTPEFIHNHAKSTMKIMHPLPRDKNKHELDKRFDGTKRDLYMIKQPRAGVRTRQAELALLLGGINNNMQSEKSWQIETWHQGVPVPANISYTIN